MNLLACLKKGFEAYMPSCRSPTQWAGVTFQFRIVQSEMTKAVSFEDLTRRAL